MLSKKLLLLSITTGIISFWIFSGFSADSKILGDEIRITDYTQKNTDEKTLKKILKTVTVKGAMAKLVQESKGGSDFDCHQEAHRIGRVGYRLFHEKAFQQCSEACHSGCYHGAMETFLNEKGTEHLAQDIDTVCNLFETSFGRFECLHGVGHGVLSYVDYDMPAAIRECQSLNGSFAQASCLGGMFMENILTAQGLGADTEGHKTVWANKEDPFLPCNKIEQNHEVQYQCYQMQTSWMLTMHNYDFDKVAKLCLEAPEQYRSVCFKSFGRDASGHTLRNPQKILEICAKVPNILNYQEECAIGAVNVIVDFWGGGLKNQATELCRQFQGRSKKACYSTLSGRLPDIFKSAKDQTDACRDFEKDFRSLCENMASVTISMEPENFDTKAVKPEPNTIFSNIKTIFINDGTFEPSVLTVRRREQITFTNRGKNLHWPASNIHPTHGIYPEFDPKKPIASGESWSFIFARTGTFRFHDHLYPEMKGVINVK